MKQSKRFLTRFAVFFALLLLPLSYAASLQAQDYKGKNRDMAKSEWFKDLNLSETQKQEIQKIRSSNKENSQKTRENLKAAKIQLTEGMKGNASDAELRSKFQEVQKYHSEMKAARFEQALAIRKVLTPEQRQKFQQIHKGRMDKWRDKHADREQGL